MAATATGVLVGSAGGSSSATAVPAASTDPAALGRHASWTTVFTATGGIEGLTGDNRGNVYVAERGTGEVAGNGKISCLDQRLDVPGVPLPVR